MTCCQHDWRDGNRFAACNLPVRTGGRVRLAHLKPDGKFLTKAYQGPGYQEFFQQLKQQFKTVVSRKPDASVTQCRAHLLASGLVESKRMLTFIIFAETTFRKGLWPPDFMQSR